MIQIPVEPAITEYLYAKASRANIPLSGTFEITPVCNMNCKMCYVRMSKQQQEAIRPLRSAKEWLELAERAKSAGMLYLLVTGGEPFLHPEIREILEGLHQMGFIMSVNTNGTMINEDTVAWLKNCRPNRLNITLYGASDETYAKLCGNPNGYTQVTNAIHLLKDAGLSVKLNCSVTSHNAFDLKEMIDYAKREQLIIQVATYMFPPLRRDPEKIGQNDRFTPEEAAYHMALTECYLNGEDMFLDSPDDQLPAMDMEVDENCGEVGEKLRCRAGKCSFWITWQGDMQACGMFPGPGDGNVFAEDFESVWKRTVESTNQIRLPAKCAGCDMRDSCKACAAMVVTETGCFDKVPQYRCAMAQYYPRARMNLKKQILENRK